MEAPPQDCPGLNTPDSGNAAACQGCPNQTLCASGQPLPQSSTATEVALKLTQVQHIILVLSGKGGVGKSTIAAQLAFALSRDESVNIGLLDIDICGPSQVQMMGVNGQEVHSSASGWSPVYSETRPNLGVMSIGFMLGSKNDAVIWRGPRKNGLIKQFLTDVDWGALDYLVIDCPPGTSDEHLSIVEYLGQSNLLGALIVTTPQEVALLDVRKEISFCRKTGVKVLGLVENMSYFQCPHCQCQSVIFPASTGGAGGLKAEMGVDLVARIPLDPQVAQASETGVPVQAPYYDSLAAFIRTEATRPQG